MPSLNLSTIKPAVLKAKEVATQEYVDNTTASALANSGFLLPTDVQAAIANNVTTIDGAKITTGSIQAGAIAAGAITADKVSADVFSGQTIIGGNIYGTRIEGASILGAVIKSSWIDYSNTGVLTNWQYFTPATVPSQYAGNFAKNTSGGLIVDSMGYVRLPGSNVVRTEAYSQTNKYPYQTYDAEYAQLTPFTIPLVSYDYYQVDIANRLVYTGGTISGSAQIQAFIPSPVFGAGGPWTIRIRFYVGSDYYECYGSGNNYYEAVSWSVKKNNVVVWSSGYFSAENGITVNQSSYGIPVVISVYNGAGPTIIVTMSSSLNFNGYTGQANLINLLECKTTNNDGNKVTYSEVSASIGVFTIQQ